MDSTSDCNRSVSSGYIFAVLRFLKIENHQNSWKYLQLVASINSLVCILLQRLISFFKLLIDPFSRFRLDLFHTKGAKTEAPLVWKGCSPLHSEWGLCYENGEFCAFGVEYFAIYLNLFYTQNGTFRLTKLNKRRAVAAQTARSHCRVLSIQYVYYLGLTKGKGLYMSSESLLSCISPFLRHLRNQDLQSRSEVIQGHTFWWQSKARVRLYIGR